MSAENHAKNHNFWQYVLFGLHSLQPTPSPPTFAHCTSPARKYSTRCSQLDVQRLSLQALAFMHIRERVHQRLIPRNVLLSVADEAARPEGLLVQLQDLALAVDISDSALIGGATLAEIWAQNKLEREDPLYVATQRCLPGFVARTHLVKSALTLGPATFLWSPRKALAEPLWSRAEAAGASSSREQRNFAIAEDILAAGLLVAHLAFVPFCLPGSIEHGTIQRWKPWPHGPPLNES